MSGQQAFGAALNQGFGTGGEGAPEPPLDLSPPSPGAATPDQQSPVFGSATSGMTFGQPKYTTDPNATALDQSASLIQQRIDQATKISNNPFAAIFAPDEVAKARDFVPQAADALQKIKQQQQTGIDAKDTARNWGLTNPNQFGPQTTDTTLANEALRQWKDEGNFNAYKALSGLGPEWKNRAELYMPDAMGKFATHVNAVQDGITALNAAVNTRSQTAYEAARDKLIKSNDLSAIGVRPENIPGTKEGWLAARGPLEAQYNQASRTIKAFQTRQDQLNQATPITDEKVGSRIEGTFQFGNGETVPGFKAVSLPGYGDVQGVMGPPGSKDIAQRGVTWSNAAPEQVKTVQEQTKAPEVQGAINKYKMAREFNETAQNDKMYKSAAGIALISDELGAIGRDVSEGSKAAGSIGLTKMLEAKYGSVDNARNKLAQEASALKDWLSKGGDKNPRLSPPSIQGIKDVAQYKHDQALKEVRDRIGQPLETAGRYGMILKNLGLDKEITDSPEIRGVYDQALARGNKELDSYPMVAIGDRRVMLPSGSSVQGAIQGTMQHPALTTPAQPAQGGGAPALTGAGTSGPSGSPGPNSPAGGAAPTAPQPPTVPPAGGGGPAPQPQVIAGQSVNAPMPPGASPGYMQATQRIESGNEASPWAAGTPRSSASGAFQFINSTWAADKPPGAPARAGDATPQQQADAFATRTAKNAATLTKAGLPVNDVSLYVAHNLGEGAGPKLLQADPNADARSIVGDKAASNNPRFFRGKPTVATVLQRYSDAMQPPQGAWGRLNSLFMQGIPAGQRAQAARNVGTAATENAPAIGSTLGAIGGSVAGPLGTVGGGAAGGAGGQVLKDYLQGNPQSPTNIAEQGALGGVLGVAPAGKPLVGLATRVLGAGSVEAGAEAARGGSAEDVVKAGAVGSAAAAGGEALGRFIGYLGRQAHQFVSKYTQPAQKELFEHGTNLAEARATLESTEPKLPGDGGDNPKYVAAEKAEEKSKAAIEKLGHDPDDIAYAAEQANQKATKGEANMERPLAAEKASVGRGYQAQRAELAATPVNQHVVNSDGSAWDASKGYGIADGPKSMVRTAENPKGAVDEAYAADAESAQRLASAPAASPAERWGNVEKAQAELLRKERDAYANNDTTRANAMRTMATSLRGEQARIARGLLPEGRAQSFMDELHDLDERYAKVMKLSEGIKQSKLDSLLSKNTPESREFETNFKRIAGDDVSAIRTFNAIKANARNSLGGEAKLMLPVIAGEVTANATGIPTMGAASAAIGLHRTYKILGDWLSAKALGKTVKFADFMRQETKAPTVNVGGRAAVGAAQEAQQ